MKRRDALKNIGLSLGYAAVAPSAMSILQSCTSEAEKWTPQFLSIDQGDVVKNLIDLILPETETLPGALQVNIPEFIDLLAFKSYDTEDQTKFSEEIDAVVSELTKNKEPQFTIQDLNTEDYVNILDTYLKTKPNDRQHFNAEKKLIFKALYKLRNQTVWVYKNSEYIGEKVLSYNPIPGKQKGCISVNEATKGKAWSLQS